MSVTDLDEAREKRGKPTENSIYVCPECGCGLMWLYVLVGVICANCDTVLEDLRIERDN